MALTKEEIDYIFSLKSDGKSNSEISRITGKARGTILSVLKNGHPKIIKGTIDKSRIIYTDKKLYSFLLETLREELYTEKKVPLSILHERAKKNIEYSKSERNFRKVIDGFREVFSLIDKQEFIVMLVQKYFKVSKDVVLSTFSLYSNERMASWQDSTLAFLKMVVSKIELRSIEGAKRLSDMSDEDITKAYEHILKKQSENISSLSLKMDILKFDKICLSYHRDEVSLKKFGLPDTPKVHEILNQMLTLIAVKNNIFEELMRRKSLKKSSYLLEENLNIFLNGLLDLQEDNNSKKLNKEETYKLLNSLMLKFFPEQNKVYCSDDKQAFYYEMKLTPKSRKRKSSNTKRCEFLDEEGNCSSQYVCENTSKIKAFISRHNPELDNFIELSAKRKS